VSYEENGVEKWRTANKSANTSTAFCAIPRVSIDDLEHVDLGSFSAHSASMSKAKNPTAKAREKKTPGTKTAEEVRSEANTLTDAERETLMAYAMRTIYGE
jgi:hypothetical protein